MLNLQLLAYHFLNVLNLTGILEAPTFHLVLLGSSEDRAEGGEGDSMGCGRAVLRISSIRIR